MRKRVRHSRNPPSLGNIYRKLGHLGKEKMRVRRFLSYRRHIRLIWRLGATILGSCASGTPGRYLGDLVAVAGTCDAGITSLLIRNGQAVTFVPEQGVISLDGHLSPGGDIMAVRQMRDANHAAFQLTFAGHMSGSRILGTYVTPRCRYTVDLRAAPE